MAPTNSSIEARYKISTAFQSFEFYKYVYENKSKIKII